MKHSAPHRISITGITLLLAALLAACSESSTTPEDTGGDRPDGGTRVDTGMMMMPDTGMMMMEPDSGMDPPDTGMDPPDTGIMMMPPDGGGGGPVLGPGDPIGTVINEQSMNCMGSMPGTCTTLNVRCPDIADQNVIIKVTRPAGASRGTVLYTTGGGGAAPYEGAGQGWRDTLSMVVAAGFTNVQVSFSQTNGWLTGPGGPRREACRYATAAVWVYENVHQSSETLPFCGTGNSGGGTAIIYSLAHYGLHTLFDFVLPTSSPVMARIDYSCNCSMGSIQTPCRAAPQEWCFGGSAAFIDGAYADSRCSDAGRTMNHQWDAEFLQDSILAPDATLAYPNTNVKVLLGEDDGGGPVASATHWEQMVTTQTTLQCVPSAGHALPQFPTGAQQIASDIAASCAVQ